MAANDEQIGGDHYVKYGDLQPWLVYEKWLGREGFIGYLRGNIFSYLVRYRDKGGVKDLKKALHDLNKLIELESPTKPEPSSKPSNPVPENQRTSFGAITPCRTYPEHPTLRCACYNYGVSQPDCPVHMNQAAREIINPCVLTVAKRCVCVSDPGECPVHPCPF